MFRQQTVGKPKETEYWGLIQESNASVSESGSLLNNFSTKRQAESFKANLLEAIRLLKAGAIPKYAFAPGTDVDGLVDAARRNPVHLRIVQLNKHLEPCETVNPFLHIKPSDHAPGYLRCH